MVATFAYAASTVAELPAKYDINAPEGQFDRVGGENIATAVFIPFLPYFDTGNTTSHVHDYDEVCPYTGSLAPDVVYAYEAAEDICVSISLCNSYYDTKVFVYEDVWTPGFPFACNDDNFNCVNPPVSYTSWLENVAFFAGHTYYIVIDGYGSSYGDYVLEIEEVDCPIPCVVECPGGSIDEGEGPCYDGYVDTYDGGCNSVPPVFFDVAPSTETITICGLSGNYDANTYRDTDWYMLNLTCESTTITACVEAEFPVLLGFVDLRLGCENVSAFYDYITADECVVACLTATLPAGDWVIWVGPSDWLNIPCTADYVLTIDGYESCVPVEDASWSTIKALYR
jgi:hypothetical protein